MINRSNKTIYAITNTVNGKKYIGSASKLEVREFIHFRFLAKNYHPCKELQADYNRYGRDSFEVSVLETGVPYTEKIARERHWMIKLKTYHDKYGYNNHDPAVEKKRRAAGLECLNNKRKVPDRRGVLQLVIIAFNNGYTIHEALKRYHLSEHEYKVLRRMNMRRTA